MLSRKDLTLKGFPIALGLLTFTFLFLSTRSNTDATNWRVLNVFRPTATEQDQGYQASPETLEQYFSPPDPERRDYHEWNARTLRDLHSCLVLNNCGLNQKKVALLAAHWFQEAVVGTFRGGEGIWAISVHKHLRELGYTTLFSISFDEALAQYRMFPDLVKVVIRNMPADCHKDPKCVKGPKNPTGIPAWKIFDFEFYPSNGGHRGASLLGGKWILSANPDDRYHGGESPIQYIGYSVEDTCSPFPVVRLAERSNQVWMLMKEIVYVYHETFSWNRSYFPLVAQELSYRFVGGWNMYQHYMWDPEKQGEMKDIEDREHGVVNLGKLNPDAFIHQVGMSKMMIGMGRPWWSPSPYNALCQGVPFLNPVMSWDHKDPWNRTEWQTQHPSLVRFEPPFVYHVHKRNYTGFVEAIKAATQTEIARFIPQHMTELAVQRRVANLMETDWKTAAEALLAERLKIKHGKSKPYIFEI